ncbi:MAG: ATP synthase subunit I [Pyrinomonadaceae bacterium]
MSEDFDPLTTESTATLISHQGIVILMLVIVALGTIAGFAFGGKGFGFGILFGGCLSLANYFWLDRSTRAIFGETATATTGILAVKYILRYVAIGLILLLVYWTGVMPITAVIAGLSAFAIAVVVQGLKNIISSSI